MHYVSNGVGDFSRRTRLDLEVRNSRHGVLQANFVFDQEARLGDATIVVYFSDLVLVTTFIAVSVLWVKISQALFEAVTVAIES